MKSSNWWLLNVRTLTQNEVHFRKQPTWLPISHWVVLGWAMFACRRCRATYSCGSPAFKTPKDLEMIEWWLGSEMPLKGLVLAVAAVVVRRRPRPPSYPTTITTTTLHTCAAALGRTWDGQRQAVKSGEGWLDGLHSSPCGVWGISTNTCHGHARMVAGWGAWGWSRVTQTLLFKGANC